MATGEIGFFDELDVDLPSLAFTGTGGIATAYIKFRIYNTKDSTTGGIDTMENLRFKVLQIVGGVPVESGTPFLDNRWIEVRSDGAGSATDATFVPDGDTNDNKIGKNRTYRFGKEGGLPEGKFREMEVRINSSSAIGQFTESFEFQVIHDENNFPLDEGTGLALGEGVIPDFRVDNRSCVIEGGAASPSVVVDNIVTFARVRYSFLGREYRITETPITFSNLDSSATPLIAGEIYFAWVTGDDTPALVVTKGLAGVAPAIPVPPSSNARLYLITVPFSGLIDLTEIDDHRTFCGFFVTAGDGLDVLIGSGLAIVRDKGVSHNKNTALGGIADDDISIVFMQDDGTFGSTITTIPLGSIPLARVTTAIGIITLVEDIRPWVNGAEPIIIDFKVPTVIALTDYGFWASDASYTIESTRGTAGTTGSSGSLAFNFRAHNAAGVTSFYSVTETAEQPTLLPADPDPSTDRGKFPVEVYRIEYEDMLTLFMDIVSANHLNIMGQIRLRKDKRYDV